MRHSFVWRLTCLLLLLSCSICSRSQSITTQKGLTTAVFNTSNGKIKIYLPDDRRPGDVISGRIVTEPDGKNERQREKNLAELKKYAVNIAGKKFSVDNADKPFQFKASGQTMTSPLELINISGITVEKITIPIRQVQDQRSAAGKCGIPSHALTGSPLRITGSFDGDASNTKCSLGNKELSILAESPRQSIILYPSDAKGIQTLKVWEKDQQKCLQEVSGVNMNISAGKLNLQKGEKTYILVSITGLQNLPDTAFLTLDNITTKIVAMKPMNHIILPLIPDSVGVGIFNKLFDVQSIKTGDFTVNVNLDLPDQKESTDHPPTTTEQLKCKCHADCSVEKAETRKGEVSYAGKVKAECIGNCAVAKITYRWHIGESGKDVAEIDGIAHAPGVTVKIKKAGSYNLYLKVTVVCTDGSMCETVCNWEETAPPDRPPTTFECGLRPEWCAGPTIKVLNYDYYPKSPDVLKTFRPGDLIGLSVLAKDLDVLLQHCRCPEGIETKQHPPTPDKLIYEWDKKNFEDGTGSLVMHSGGETNSVLYQLPFCIQQFPVRDKITVTIKNAGVKANDEPLQVEFTIKLFIPPSKYKEQYVQVRTLKVSVSAKILNTPDDVICKEETGGDCIVLPAEWTVGSTLGYTSTITLSRPADTPPDNLIVLNAGAADNDDLTLKCFHKGKLIIEKLPAVYDDCEYTWTVTEGLGSFPVGNKGASVVFAHNYGGGFNKVTIQCTVTDSKKQFADDDPPPITKSIEPREKPKAFVGVGDISYKKIIRDGHGELFKAAKIAMKNYEIAGYQVNFEAVAKQADIEAAIKSNGYQAIMLIGHGTEDGNFSCDGGNFVPGNVESWVFEKWRCLPFTRNKQPLIQELMMLGCWLGRGEWYRKFFSLEKYYARRDWVWSSAMYSSILNYVKKEHKPLPPRIIDK